MADTKLKSLPDITTLAATDILYGVTPGTDTDYKITAAEIKTFTSASPTLVTPDIGTPSAGVGTNFTGIPLSTGTTGTLAPARGGTGVANNAASTITISGSFATTFTVTNTTGVTLPTTGTLATLAGSESLSNKTLVAPVLGAATATSINKVAITAPATSATLTVIDGTTLTGPAASDTLVGRASTDTLTNKTLTSPTITGGTHTALTSFGMASGQAGQVPQPPYVSGRFYGAGPPGGSITAANTTPLVNDTVYAVPCYAAAPIVIKTLSLRTSSTSANVGASIKVGVYAADGTNGTPGTRLATTASGTSVADAATTTDIKITLDATASVAQGWFYVAVLQTATTGLRFQYSSGADNYTRTQGATSNANVFAGTAVFGYTVSQAYASGMPSPFGTAVANTTVNTNPAFAFEIN